MLLEKLALLPVKKVEKLLTSPEYQERFWPRSLKISRYGRGSAKKIEKGMSNARLFSYLFSPNRTRVDEGVSRNILRKKYLSPEEREQIMEAMEHETYSKLPSRAFKN